MKVRSLSFEGKKCIIYNLKSTLSTQCLQRLPMAELQRCNYPIIFQSEDWHCRKKYRNFDKHAKYFFLPPYYVTQFLMQVCCPKFTRIPFIPFPGQGIFLSSRWAVASDDLLVPRACKYLCLLEMVVKHRLFTVSLSFPCLFLCL